jgi:tRNA (guanine-N7-)-methyltransferase
VAAEPHRRQIKSFVLRQGRTTPAQARAFEDWWARYGIEYGAGRSAELKSADGRLRFEQAFRRVAPVVLEIGFGNGEQLHHAAASDPGRDYLGIEVHRPGVGRLLNAVGKDGLTNVRVYAHDAVEVLKHEIPDGSLEEVRIYFPDPWPKKRHHKRRLIQPELVALLAAKLRRGGLLHLATDWQDYAEHMLAVLEGTTALANTCGPGQYAPCPAWRRDTHFERRGRRLGHGVWDLLYERA